MKPLYSILFILLAALAAAIYFSAFIVDTREKVLVVQIGKVVNEYDKPGLYFKVPFIQQVRRFNKRILALDTPTEEVNLADQKRLVVDAFIRYRIENPLKYYQSVNNTRRANRRLSATLNAVLKDTLGKATFEGVVRDKRDQLMRQITAAMNKKTRTELGIQIVDVRIKRVDLPNANSQAIFRRMQTERQREAAEHRAEGNEQAQKIKADADRQAIIIKANATRQSELIRGEGEAKRNKIFADAFGKDADFFQFYRTMQAYRTAIRSKDTRMVLSPSSDFFRYFNDPAGTMKAAK